MRDGYAFVVRKLVRFSVLAVVLVVAFGVGVGGIARVTPTSFLPEEDQGAFFMSGATAGRCLRRPHQRGRRAGRSILKSMPQVQDTVSIIGYSFLDIFSSSNTAFMVVMLKPFEDRKKAADSAQALIAKTFGDGQQIRTATVLPFNLPPVIGLGTTGGFEYQLESFEGADPATLGSVVPGAHRRGQPGSRVSPSVFSTYGAAAPSLYLDIDRDKAQALGLTIDDVFTTLQATLGGYYINNFNLFGRTWQVNLEGEAANRRDLAGSVADLHPQQQGRHGASAVDRLSAHRHRSAGHHALQQLSFGDHQRQSRRRASPPARRWPPWRRSRPRRCRPASASNGPARLFRNRGPAARPGSSSEWPCCSPSCSLSACTRAG